MDEMKIGSGFMKRMLRDIIRKLVKKNIGVDMTADIKDLQVTFDGNAAHAHMELDVWMSKEELEKLLKNMVFKN